MKNSKKKVLKTVTVVVVVFLMSFVLNLDLTSNVYASEPETSDFVQKILDDPSSISEEERNETVNDVIEGAQNTIYNETETGLNNLLEKAIEILEVSASLYENALKLYDRAESTLEKTNAIQEELELELQTINGEKPEDKFYLILKQNEFNNVTEVISVNALDYEITFEIDEKVTDYYYFKISIILQDDEFYIENSKDVEINEEFDNEEKILDLQLKVPYEYIEENIEVFSFEIDGLKYLIYFN